MIRIRDNHRQKKSANIKGLDITNDVLTYDASRDVSVGRAGGAVDPGPASHLTTNREKPLSIKTDTDNEPHTHHLRFCFPLHCPRPFYLHVYRRDYLVL